jgi:hypothetical protein
MALGCAHAVVSLTGDPAFDLSITNPGDTDLVQLTFATSVPDGTRLLVNGCLIGTFGIDILPVSDPIPVNAPPGAVYYQVTVDTILLQTGDDDVNIKLNPYLLRSVALLNVDFSGGRQELLALPCGQFVCRPY